MAAQEETDINALNGPCYNCGGTGHLARDCPSPPKGDKGGKGAKGGDKGGKGGKGGKVGYKGAMPQHPPKWCPKCNKPHSPETCWVTYPHLKEAAAKRKKVQSVEGEQEVECNFIDLGALEISCTTCTTDFVTPTSTDRPSPETPDFRP